MIVFPKNWGEFQHYKDRNPAWIKLHKRLLDDYDFQCLPVASRALAPMLWLLASEHQDGRINADAKKLAFRLRLSTSELEQALKPLIESGFFVAEHDASDVLAEPEPLSSPETEEETEKKKISAFSACPPQAPDDLPVRIDKPKNGVPPCPYQAVADAYHEALPQLPRLAVMSEARKRTLQARWRELCAEDGITEQAAGIDAFRAFFRHVSASAFLTGSGKPGTDGRVWKADFDWLLAPRNFVRVVEGRYHGKKAA